MKRNVWHIRYTSIGIKILNTEIDKWDKRNSKERIMQSTSTREIRFKPKESLSTPEAEAGAEKTNNQTI